MGGGLVNHLGSIRVRIFYQLFGLKFENYMYFVGLLRSEVIFSAKIYFEN